MSVNDALQIILGLFSNTTFIGIAVALVGGWLLKKFPGFDNRFIPAATAVVAVITQLINFFTGQPPQPTPIPHAPADSTISMLAAPYLTAGFFDGGLFKAVLAAAIQWLMTDKLYTAQKKAVDGIREVNDDVPISKSKVSG